MNIVLLIIAIVGAAALITVEIFSSYIVSLFGGGMESALYTQFAIMSFRIYLSAIIPAVINKGTFIFLQALGKAKESTIISIMREIVSGVMPPVVMPLFMGLDKYYGRFPQQTLSH